MRALTIVSALVLVVTSVSAGFWFKANIKAAIDSDGFFGAVVVISASLGMVGLVGLLTFLVREACIEADALERTKSASNLSAHQKQA